VRGYVGHAWVVRRGRAIVTRYSLTPRGSLIARPLAAASIPPFDAAMSSRPSYTCSSCSAVGPSVTALCARCQVSRYCDRTCQKSHWKSHKTTCVPKGASSLEEEMFKKPAAAGASASSASATALSESAPTIASMAAEAASSSTAPAAPFVLNPITFSLPSSLTPSHPLLRVADLPGRGRAFVAASDIEAGTLLLTEESVYAHSEGAGSNEEQRVATLAALTKVMIERYPEALAQLCHHADHELPEHTAIDTPPEGVDAAKWAESLARVDSNQFTSSRGMMCSPTVSICNHSCYPNADLIVREVPAAAASAASSTSAAATRPVEQVSIYAIQPIAAGAEVTINYLGSDSLCRWYAPSMIRQESFTSQWSFECDCSKCKGEPKKQVLAQGERAVLSGQQHATALTSTSHIGRLRGMRVPLLRCLARTDVTRMSAAICVVECHADSLMLRVRVYCSCCVRHTPSLRPPGVSSQVYRSCDFVCSGWYGRGAREAIHRFGPIRARTTTECTPSTLSRCLSSIRR
jgi:hypothetical protein